MPVPRRLLLLGGTSEASALARRLAGRDDLVVVTSLAGRTARPVLPPGEVRIGGFGGAEGLAAYLRATGVDVVVDATHPFAAVMRWHAEEACRAVGVPRLRVERPGWVEQAGDHWRRVPSLAGAAAAVAAAGWGSVLLTTGRTDLAAFAPASEGRRRWVVRCIDPPTAVPLAPAEVVLDRGPFTVEGEEALMAAHDVDVLVTKDSGGDAAAAKLVAARRRGIPVVMVDRPPSPPGPTVTAVDDAVAWLG